MTTYARPARLALAALVAGALYAAPAQADNFLIEDFDNVATLGASGWVQVNASSPALPPSQASRSGYLPKPTQVL